MRPFGLSLSTLVLRYYFMMLVIIAAGFTGQWWLAILALPIFLSCMMGVRFSNDQKSKTSAAFRSLERKEATMRKAS